MKEITINNLKLTVYIFISVIEFHHILNQQPYCKFHIWNLAKMIVNKRYILDYSIYICLIFRYFQSVNCKIL